METKTVSKRLDTLMFLYDWHTKLFHNVIVGISEKDAQNRLNTKANHIAWIIGSMVHQRYEIAQALGVASTKPPDPLFKDHWSIQENVKYPTLSEFEKDWENITPYLRDALLNVTNEQLDRPFKMPGEEPMTHFDLIVFTTDREAYCIGQVGLYRRLLGYEAMKYQ
jgi:hypothetical protein